MRGPAEILRRVRRGGLAQDEHPSPDAGFPALESVLRHSHGHSTIQVIIKQE